MPIQMSGATINDSSRQTLKSTSVDTSVTSGGVTANTARSSLFSASAETGVNLAGITASFASNFETAMSEYKQQVNASLNELEAVDSNVAFKGEALSAALKSFIIGVKEVAGKYLAALEVAENQIITSVAEAYRTQDADISGDLSGDTATVSASGPNMTAQ